jgi:hypothetical protein
MDMVSRRAEAKFYEVYGRALAKWADLELCLAHLFGKVTDMHETVATRVFFSVHTSRGRLDMLSEALPAQAGHPDTVARPSRPSLRKRASTMMRGTDLPTNSPRFAPIMSS